MPRRCANSESQWARHRAPGIASESPRPCACPDLQREEWRLCGSFFQCVSAAGSTRAVQTSECTSSGGLGRNKGNRKTHRLVRPGDIDLKLLGGRTNAANDFRGPQRFAEQRYPAVFGFADGAKGVPCILGLISIEPSPRKLLLQRGVAALYRTAGADTERLALKALKQLLELRFPGLREHQTALGGFAKMNIMKAAEFAHTIEVAGGIHHKEFVGGERGENGSPNQSSVVASHRLAAFRSQEFESHGFDVSAEIEPLDVHREWWQLQRAGVERRLSRRAHTSDSACGNFAWKSGDCLRTSSQSKKASGVSSQMRNQLAISSFSARLLGSTFGFRAIISARRLPRRATFSTRSTAARSPWV